MDEGAAGPTHTRHYTIEQANAALPWVSERLTRIREALEQLSAPESRRALELIDADTGGSHPGRDTAAATLALLTAASELQAVDIVLRDPASGLVDFPALRDGEEVYLCWRAGEQRVEWWHTPESGFAGRRRL